MRVYEKKSYPRMARDFDSMDKKGNIEFDNAVQRSFVWQNTTKDNRMSMLIDSMLRGLPVPPIYAVQYKRNDSKVLSLLDGRQRITTIIKFLRDEFSLVNIPTFENEDGNEIDLNGLTFSTLPQDFQDSFRTYSLVVYYYEDMTDEDVADMFSRLNNGKSLTAIENTRARAKSFNAIRSLASHKLFTDALSDKSIAGYVNEDIVIKSYIMLYSEKKSLDTKDVRPVITSAEITEEQKANIEAVFTKLYEVHDLINGESKLNKKVAKRIYTRTHLVSLIPIMNKAIEEQKSNEDLAKWLLEFFNGGKAATTSEDYNYTTGGGSNHENSVNARIKAIEESYEKFFLETEVSEVAATEEPETDE